MTVRVPLRDRHGNVRAWAIVDDADAPLVESKSWFLSTSGYAARSVRTSKRTGRRSQLMHRLIAGVDGLSWKEVQVDHVNLIRLDNRRENLRRATHAQNAHNRGNRRGSTSRFRGVCWVKAERKWVARVMVDGRPFGLGSFESEEEAGRLAADFRAKHMPYSSEALANKKADIALTTSA